MALDSGRAEKRNKRYTAMERRVEIECEMLEIEQEESPQKLQESVNKPENSMITTS